MRIRINHDHCEHANAYADRCLAATLLNPLGHERFCAARVEDDGKDEMTVSLVFEGVERTLVLHNREEVELAAAEGWPAFLHGTVASLPS
ncbi:MAG: hypothetical protein WD040_04480 [Anaerolineales bacterium]